MRRFLKLAPLLLALGSCQSDNAPTQPDPASEQTGVAARLLSAKTLPAAQRFCARLTIGGEVGSWAHAPYSKGAELNLGKVKRGAIVILDVRGYSLDGSDTLWKWFARKSDSATGSVLTIDAEVEGIEAPAVVAGKLLSVPAGSWYTTDTVSWEHKGVVDSSGTIPALSGTVLLVRLRMVVPGTADTLHGELLRYALPRKPSIAPAARELKMTDSVRVSGAKGDSLVYCEGAGCTDWVAYAKALAPRVFVLRTRALRDGLASPVEEATFTLAPPDTAPVEPQDTLVGDPSILPEDGPLASSDSIRITPAKDGDSIRFTIDGGRTWSVYSGPIKAGEFTVQAVSHRGRFHSDTARATYTESTAKPTSPSIRSSCTVVNDCDPGTTVEITSTDTSLRFQYAFLADSANWKRYEGRFELPSSTKVFARAFRDKDTSAVQTASYTIVQPDTVAFAIVRRTTDTVWVRLSTGSGAISFKRGSDKDSTGHASADSIAVRVADSLSAWTWRGTARSAIRIFRAVAATQDPVGMPEISPKEGALASSDTIRITPARTGDSIRYSIGGEWIPYVGSFKAGAFTVRAVAFRGGRFSDTAKAVYTLSLAKPTSPDIVPLCSGDACDPGDSVRITTSDTGDVHLQYAMGPDSTGWEAYKAAIPLSASVKVFARAIRAKDTSAVRSANLVVMQPDTVVFAQVRRNRDTVWVKLSSTSGTIWYARGASETSAKYSDSIPVRVLDSVSAWSGRGTAKSAVKGYRAPPMKPDRPLIVSPLDSIIVPGDSIDVEVATRGDTLQYDIGSGWQDWKGKVAPGLGGPFTFRARSRRYGAVSDSAVKTYFVDTASLDAPEISPSIAGKADPGTQFVISVGAGSNLEWTEDLAKSWTATETPLKITADRDTTVHVRATALKKISLIRSFAIRIQQPDTVGFFVKTAYPDSVRLGIAAVSGDTVLFSRNAEASVTNTRLTGTVYVTVKANDSITVWTRRGTASGANRGYKYRPAPPKVPSILPARRAVHDTTDIRLSPATAGDSLVYRIGSASGWTPYAAPFQLPTGSVTLAVRAIRNGGSTDTSLDFTVHASPRKPEFTGCTVDCDPGSELTFSASNGYDIHVKVGDGDPGMLSSPFALPIDSASKVCAYSDSSGHRSADTCVDVAVMMPVAPNIVDVMLVRTASYDSAYVKIKATQVGDTLTGTYARGKFSPAVVATNPLVKIAGIKWTSTDSVLEMWTKRGNTVSSSVRYTISRLPPPKAIDAAGTYAVGKTIAFELDPASGALETDGIQISTDSGKTWDGVATMELGGSVEVWARSSRAGASGSVEYSSTSKVLFAADSLLASGISLVIGDGSATWMRTTFDPAATSSPFRLDVDKDTSSVGIEFAWIGPRDDIEKVQMRCDNCASSDFVGLNLDAQSRADVGLFRPYGFTQFTFRITTRWGYARDYAVWVNRTAPWNPAPSYDSIVDKRDGVVRVYKTVTFGGKTWMAENLRYKGPGAVGIGTCYDDDTSYCGEFGRYYTWAEAMGFDNTCNTGSCGSIIELPHQGICPDGYHVPTVADWESIATFLGESMGSEALARSVRTTSYWTSPQWDNVTGPFDRVGFRGLPIGQWSAGRGVDYFGMAASWWATEEAPLRTDRVSAFEIGRTYREPDYFGVAQMVTLDKSLGQGLRCVK